MPADGEDWLISRQARTVHPCSLHVESLLCLSLPPACFCNAGSHPAPGSDAADSSDTAAHQAAPQPSNIAASSAEDSSSVSSTAAAAEDAQSLQATAEGSADLGGTEGAGGAEAAAVVDEDDGDDGEADDEDGEEGYESDIELTAAGLQYATTRWDGSRNMTPNRRPTREEREGYIDNEELQDEVRRLVLGVCEGSQHIGVVWQSEPVCGDER